MFFDVTLGNYNPDYCYNIDRHKRIRLLDTSYCTFIDQEISMTVL